MQQKILTPLIIIFVLNSCQTDQKSTDSTLVNHPPTIFNQSQESDSLKIKGTLICAHCYALNEENTGKNHILPESGFVKGCASQCANLGYPIAVLSMEAVAGTNIWVIRTTGALFADYMGEETEVKGSFVSKGIIEPSEILVATEPGHWVILL
jgi:hypothetical protein